MSNEDFIKLTEEEIETINKNRDKNRGLVNLPGIGTTNIYVKAKLKKKKFIDTTTFIEREGDNAR